MARRTLAYVPHLGGAAMVVARTAINPRVGLAGRVGVASRGYSERSSYVVLSIPEGVDPARSRATSSPRPWKPCAAASCSASTWTSP